MDRNNKQTIFHTNDARSSVSVQRNLLRTWFTKSHDYPENHRGEKRNRHYKYLPAVIALLFATPVNAETVGGVSATAAPVANSSGSVTNQAIQVLQGPYITNTYGGGIQCQGPTVNFTPYVTGAFSQQHPYEAYYDSPVYDMTTDDDGNLNNPGDILYYVPTRTGQKNNTNLSVGFSATWSRPLDKKLQEQCKEAAATQIALQQQLTANKRLDFEIARLKNCGELKLRGIQFHPKSPYYSVCADVMVNNPPGHSHPHRHAIPSVSSSSETQNEAPSQHDSSDAALLGAPLGTKLGVSSPLSRQSSSLPSSQQVSPLLTKDQQEVLRAVPR